MCGESNRHEGVQRSVYPVLQWWSFSLNDELLNLRAHQVLLLKRKVETNELVKKHPKRENVNLQIVRCTVTHSWLLNSHLLSRLLPPPSPPSLSLGLSTCTHLLCAGLSADIFQNLWSHESW